MLHHSFFRFLAYHFLAATALLWSCGASQPGELKGLIVGISDGDTVTLLTPEKQQFKIRLAEIDAPENGQPYGRASRQLLSDLIFQKTVSVLKVDTDRYGRIVGRIYCNGLDVSAEMVRQGGAWVYLKYNRDKSLPKVEAEARAARRGLWGLQDDQIIPPWEYRKRNKKTS